VKLTFNPLK